MCMCSNSLNAHCSSITYHAGHLYCPFLQQRTVGFQTSCVPNVSVCHWSVNILNCTLVDMHVEQKPNFMLIRLKLGMIQVKLGILRLTDWGVNLRKIIPSMC